jgi:SAM-dependent methyltransferase
MHLIHRKTCRVCGSSALKKVISLDSQHLQGSFIKKGKELPPMRKIPLDLVRCNPEEDENACGLLQMAHSVPPEILYAAYWYRSGTNQTMRDHLAEIAKSSQEIIKKDKAIVLDIGCNDGTLLKNYPDQYIKYGIDPSDVASNIDGEFQIIRDLFPSEKLLSKLGDGKFDVITSIAMFYDLEDPVNFARNIRDILAKNGIWVFEMSYMPLMLEMNSYDTICHEHLEYYSLSVIENILKRASLRLIKTEINDINGGSIRCYVTHHDFFDYDDNLWMEQISELRKKEFDLALDTDEPYKNFQASIETHRAQLIKLIQKIFSEGKRIHIYGASTKGNTILQWCGLDEKVIDFAAERNPDKYGALTLGTNIPIISEAESRGLNPDYYLVLPWHFKKEFISREVEMINAGVGFIFPLPDLEVIKK